VPPHRNLVPIESHRNGQRAGYFPRTMRTLLLELGYSEPPLFVSTLRLLCRNSYLWRVRVIIYERPMTDHIHRIRYVVEASTLRWTFEGGMREDAREALALLRHEAEEQMEQSQYHHFLSHTREGVEAVVMPAGYRDHIGCFTNQVKLTCALVQDLDEVVKEVKLLGEHEEESSQKITEREALCKRLREDAQKLRDKRATLEGMIKSRDELLMEMAEEYGLNHMGENDDKDEDDDGEGNTAAPPAPTPLGAALEEIIKEEAPMEMVPEQEALVAHVVILADAESEPPQPRLFNKIMRDYEESPPKMANGPLELDGLDDLDDPTKANTNVDEWFHEDRSNDRD
jgi:hypothetical protein